MNESPEIRLEEQEEQKQREQSFFMHPYGGISNTITHLVVRDKDINPITNQASIKAKNFSVIVKNIDKVKKQLNLQSAKLLLYGESMFIRANSHRNKGKIDFRVSLPILRVSAMSGWKTTDDAMRDNGKAIKKYLNALHSIEITGKEYTGKKTHSFRNVSIIGSRGTDNGEVWFYFDPLYGEYLLDIKGYVQYNRRLFKCTTLNSFLIGEKLCEQFTYAKNYVTGTPNRLKVETLLGYTNFQTFEHSEKHDQGHWRENIKDRLEDCLEELFALGIITYWKYVYPGGEPIPDDVDVAASYETWSRLCIEFELADPPDISDQIEIAQAIHDKVEERRKEKKINQRVEEIEPAQIKKETPATTKVVDEQNTVKLPEADPTTPPAPAPKDEQNIVKLPDL